MRHFAVCMFAFSLYLSGCSHQPQLPPHEVQYQRYLSENTEALQQEQEQALDSAEQALEESEQQQLAFYSPGYAEQLSTAVTAARRASLADDQQALVDEAAKALASLQLGLETKQQGQRLLADILARRDEVTALQADKVARRSYQAFQQALQDAFMALEQSNPPDEDTLQALLNQLDELEQQTLLTRFWQPAQRTLAQAESEDADELAPATYASATTAVADVERYIRQTDSQIDTATQQGHQALRQAQHALFVAREAKRLQQLNAREAEQTVLRFESLLHELSLAVDGADRRHMALYDQMLAIKQRLDELKHTAASANTRPASSPLTTPTEAAPSVPTEAAAKAPSAQAEAANDAAATVPSDDQDSSSE
jgi:hypothetical protein